MAEVTYYFNAYTVAVWTNPNNMIDGLITTYGSTTTDGNTQVLTGNTCPGTDLGTITKVEIRLYGYGDGDDRIDFRLRIGGTTGPFHETTMPSSPDWTAYIDVTGDPSPLSWDWTLIKDADIDLEYDKVGKGNSMNCAKVEIRVTYTPVGVPSGTVYLVKATGKRTQLATGAEPIKVDPATGRRGLQTAFTKFLVKEDDGRYTAKSA